MKDALMQFRHKGKSYIITNYKIYRVTDGNRIYFVHEGSYNRQKFREEGMDKFISKLENIIDNCNNSEKLK